MDKQLEELFNDKWVIRESYVVGSVVTLIIIREIKPEKNEMFFDEVEL